AARLSVPSALVVGTAGTPLLGVVGRSTGMAGLFVAMAVSSLSAGDPGGAAGMTRAGHGVPRRGGPVAVVLSATSKSRTRRHPQAGVAAVAAPYSVGLPSILGN